MSSARVTKSSSRRLSQDDACGPGNYRSSKPPPAKNTIQIRIVCAKCKSRKTRCDGEQPCSRCAQDNLTCVYLPVYNLATKNSTSSKSPRRSPRNKKKNGVGIEPPINEGLSPSDQDFKTDRDLNLGLDQSVMPAGFMVDSNMILENNNSNVPLDQTVEPLILDPPIVENAMEGIQVSEDDQAQIRRGAIMVQHMPDRDIDQLIQNMFDANLDLYFTNLLLHAGINIPLLNPNLPNFQAAISNLEIPTIREIYARLLRTIDPNKFRDALSAVLKCPIEGTYNVYSQDTLLLISTFHETAWENVFRRFELLTSRFEDLRFFSGGIMEEDIIEMIIHLANEVCKLVPSSDAEKDFGMAMLATLDKLLLRSVDIHGEQLFTTFGLGIRTDGTLKRLKSDRDGQSKLKWCCSGYFNAVIKTLEMWNEPVSDPSAVQQQGTGSLDTVGPESGEPDDGTL